MKPRLLLMAVMLAGAAAALKASPARADIGTDAAERVARYKQIQQERLMREPLAERRELAERFQAWKKTHRKQLAAGKHVPIGAERLRPDADTPARRETRAARATRLAHVASPSRVTALASNQRVNDPSTDLDPSTTAQSEVSIAADGQNVVVTWNDGEGLNYAPPTNAQGYGWSTDGGITWTDGGAPPAPTGLIWFSDPVVVVNPKSHKFYFSALVVDPNDFSFGQNGVGVIQGSFSGGVFSWGTPVVAIQAAANTKIYDKEWMAVDSTSGNVYVSYVDFFVGGDQIEFKRSTDAGATFPTTSVLSSAQDQGYVQAPRVVVGPTGEVYVAWYAIGNGVTSAWARDFYRIKKSINQGLTFGSQATLDSAFVDFGNGAPGFNRGNSFAFPSLAVDNTTGPHRARVYATWNESADFYNTADDIGYHVPIIIEPPDFGNTAAAARALTVGDRMHGNILSGDEDWFKFTGAKDSTVIIFCDSLKSTLQAAMELRSSDGVQQLAYVSSGQALDPVLIVYSLPQTGTYYIRLHGLGGSLGAYSLFTGYHRPQPAPQNDRARDHRDVMLKYADAPSGAWPATTVRVNSEPADFDDWLPEVAVGGNGKPYVAWYDFHDYSGGAFPGSGSTTYLSRSDDGGTTWAAGSPVSGVT
ncbi:MAG: PPC domain-containing protein, partial [Candidatus Eisenbacteria bacterium]